ncbi:protein O-GlcNAcase-like isoform X1 [Diadema antillarum]|uniref:protein O-GlcNAcase-like isoform X1 n=1 Tax=Diadema antillarum TaxID=105358 RepID=UPI003A869D30
MFSADFLCGVVEGFYGRPWTPEQRKDLFCLMNRLGLNMYMYAPKDDCKHRAYWRDLYSVEEAEQLTSLITAAKEQGVLFVYALSPGLDITFSNPKEVTSLKRKLEQVSQFGCEAFALLFDDIDTEMSVADTEVFQSFAHAQVSVTNEAFQYLGQPRFLFCPTEYCATRAHPSVKNSEYLQTLGAKLLPDIHIMWTGGKVVSKFITIESVKELTSVIKRKPLIWDNIHANDYDQQRMYLGPYKGRSTDLKSYISGVLTNPNCEYFLNHIALHTLATWNKAGGSADTKKDEPPGDMTEEAAISADEQLETEGNNEPGQRKLRINHGDYDPDHALKLAIADWLNVFSQTKLSSKKKVVVIPPVVTPPLPLTAPPVQSVNTCMSVTPTTNTSFAATLEETTGVVASEILKKTEVFSPLGVENFTPSSIPVNSLVSQPPSMEDTLEPMECNGDNAPADSNALFRTSDADSTVVPTKGSTSISTSTATSSKVTDIDMHEADVAEKSPAKEPQEVEGEEDITPLTDSNTESATDCEMQVDGSAEQPVGDSESSNGQERKSVVRERVTEDDLALMCELFYLPYEHGQRATQKLEDIYWLRTNAFVLCSAKKTGKTSEKAAEWTDRAAEFFKFCKDVKQLMSRLLNTPNRSLLYDIYPYMWDMEIAVSMIGSFVKWLALGLLVEMGCDYLDTFYTWCSKNHKEAFLSGDKEPWLFRGGLTGEFHRMLPLDSAGDLFIRQMPRQVSSKVYTIRPYLAKDEEALYNVCSMRYSEDNNNDKSFDEYPQLIGDKHVGHFLTLSPEYCFVVEESENIIGYVLAALDVKVFRNKIQAAWMPELHSKYPLQVEETKDLSPAQEMIKSLHEEEVDMPVTLYARLPSPIFVDILPTVEDQGLIKNLLACVLAALKSNGSTGVHTAIPEGDEAHLEFYAKLGFFRVPEQDQFSEGFILLGRGI